MKNQSQFIINLQANTKEAEKSLDILKQSAKIDMSDDLRKEFKVQQIETEEFLKRVASIPADQMTPDLAKEVSKEYKKIADNGEKLNKKLLKEVTKTTTFQIELLEENIKRLSEKIAEKEVEAKKFTDTYTFGDQGIKFKDEKDERSFTREVAEDTGLREQMRGVSGKQNIQDFQSMIDNAETLETTLSKMPQIYKKINKGIEEGKDLKTILNELTPKQREQVEALIATNHKNFDAETAIEQVLVKRQLEQAKLNKLKEEEKVFAEIQNDIDVKKVEKDKQQLALNKEIQKVSQVSTQSQQEALEFYQKFGKSLNDIRDASTKTFTSLKQNVQESTNAIKEKTKEVDKNRTTLGKAANQVFNYGIAFTALRRIYRETLRTVKDLDKALTEMAIVTTLNRQET